MENIINLQNDLVKQVMEILISIPEITIKKEETAFNLSKENVKFCVIKNNMVYLLTSNGNYEEVAQDMLTTHDEFLSQATNSIWIATGKKIHS